MKVNYKNALKDMFKRFDEYYRGCHKDEESMKMYLLKIHKTDEQRYLSAQSFHFWKEERAKKVEHLFIKDDSLFEFFNQTKVNVSKSLHEFAQVNHNKCFIVHSKTESFGFKIMFKNGAFVAVTARGVDDKSDNCNVCWSSCPESKINDADSSYPRMAVNLLYYMSSFPDKVTNGVPDDYRASSVGSIRNRCIGTSEKIFHSTGSKATHFRQGYFRHYPSDSSWYKNVAGTTKWIDACVVNGSAKTIKE